MFTQQPRTNDQFRKAIEKLVRGLEKRDREHNDRRRHHRFYFGVKVNLCVRLDGDNYRNLCEAWAVDLSIGGLGFMTERKIRDTDVIYVSFEQLLGKPCYIPIHIRKCIPLIGSVYQVHGQFAYPDEVEVQ